MVASEDLINKKESELPKLYANNGNLLLLSRTVIGSAGINVALAAQNALAGLQSISPAQNSCIVKDNLQSEEQINIKCCIKTLRGDLIRNIISFISSFAQQLRATDMITYSSGALIPLFPDTEVTG